ncbi:dTDP-4-dehydrorhamnose reductase [Niabella yanshanensis]|uniref:dTDP-4-dehydrorhamnose reductase n=1 Tax=Niabella yanshanensis TaxID=577386 RepID=A0ABZ0W9G9_9BACT|nr:dTDP-4-dehydrorhamnose reductase [Niabella yanshanensis]WQD39781.1 dTDP-4-dehydrorhamnose reductase [Niabella yanshanensis]
MAQKTILVTGSNGQLGSDLRALAVQFPDFNFLFTDRATLSITDEAAVNLFFEVHQPDFCVNCAAYTAVDKAEDGAELSSVQALNADAVGFLARACTTYHTKFIQISTDYVFEGNGTEPYRETDLTQPVSVYGVTKLAGEQLAAEFTDAIIIRTAWVYSTFGKNFVKTMIRLMTEKPQISVVSDQYGTPTYAADLAAAIMHIISSGNWVPGIYHYTNEGRINWHEFALAIKELIHSECEVKAIPTIQYPTPAKRPAWSVLDKTKIKETYQLEIPDWKASLELCLGKMQ